MRIAAVRPSLLRPDEVVLSEQAAVVAADLLYDGLTEIDGATGSLRPGLAGSWGPGDGYRSWVFHLDPMGGVSADVVVRALAQLEVSSTEGLPAAHPGAALTAGIEAVSAIDDGTVLIELVRPNAGLPWILSGVAYSIIGLNGAPTGDYQVVSDTASSLRMQRRAGRGGQDGPFPVIEMVWADDGEAAYRLLTDEAVDAAVVDPGSIADAEQRFGWRAVASSAVRFYVLNPGSPELADRDRRAGLLELLESGELVAEAGRVDLIAVDGLVSPAFAGHQANGCGAGCDGPDAGSGVVDTGVADWPSDVSLRVTYAGDGQATMAAALAGQLVAAGVAAASRETTARDLAKAIVDGSPDLFAFGWVAPAGSIDAVVPPLLRADSPANVARFASADIESLLEEAAEKGDDEARWMLLDQAHRLALAEAKVLPVAASTSALVLADNEGGLKIRADGSLDLESSG